MTDGVSETTGAGLTAFKAGGGVVSIDVYTLAFLLTSSVPLLVEFATPNVHVRAEGAEGGGGDGQRTQRLYAMEVFYYILFYYILCQQNEKPCSP